MYIGEEKGDEIVEEIVDEAEKDVVGDIGRDAIEDDTVGADAGRGRSAHPALRDLRAQIDSIDRTIMDALVARYRLVEQIGGVKGRQDLPALDPAREALIVRKAAATARARGLPAEGVRRLFWMVIEYCRCRAYRAEPAEDGRRRKWGTKDV